MTCGRSRRRSASDGAELREAIGRCLKRRGTAWTSHTPDALTPEFYSGTKQDDLWKHYRREKGFLSPPPEAFSVIGDRILKFVAPVIESILAGSPFERHWQAGGPWGRLRPYAEYKESEVEWLGRIPKHWEANRLKYATKLNPTAATVRNLSRSLEVSFIPMEAVGEYGGLDLTSVKPLAEVNSGYTYFGEGDIVVAKITPCFENGKGALAAGLVNRIAFGTTELHVLRAEKAADRGFLFYVSMSDAFRKLGEAEMYGAGGQKRVPDSFIENLRHPLPPLPEQRAIAGFLDRETAQIDALVAKKERLIELLQEKRTALITRAVTKGLDPDVKMKDSGIEWLGEIPAHWNVSRLNHVVTKFVDYRGKTPEKVPFGVPLVTAKNIKNQIVDFSESQEYITEELYPLWMIRGFPELGDVVVTTEAPLGETAQIANTNIALAQRIILLKAVRESVTNEYLKYHFAGDSGVSELQTRATGSTAMGIKASHLKASLITTPPMAEQNQITAFLDREIAKLGALGSRIHQAIARLKELRTALISAAVTGKIDVRDEAAAKPRAVS